MTNYSSIVPLARYINADLRTLGYEPNMTHDAEGRIIEARKDGETWATFWQTGRDEISGFRFYARGEVWSRDDMEWNECDWRTIIAMLSN